jgi:hypothetical protein
MADENVGQSPPNYTTLAGKVRVLVGDTDPQDLETPTAGQGQYAWYSDEQLEVLGSLNGDSAKRVAIWVLSQVGMSQALLLKKWKSEDLEQDGTAIIKAMEATLKRLAAEVDKEEALTGDLEFFGIYDTQDAAPRYPYPYTLPIDWRFV